MNKMNHCALPHDQETLLLRSLLSVAMRRLGVLKLDVDAKEFEAAGAGSVYMECRRRQGGGFITTIKENFPDTASNPVSN